MYEQRHVLCHLEAIGKLGRYWYTAMHKLTPHKEIGACVGIPINFC